MPLWLTPRSPTSDAFFPSGEHPALVQRIGQDSGCSGEGNDDVGFDLEVEEHVSPPVF